MFFGIGTVPELSSVAQERRTAFFVACSAWFFPPDKGLLDHGLTLSHTTLHLIGKWWGQRIFLACHPRKFPAPSPLGSSAGSNLSGFAVSCCLVRASRDDK